MMTYFHDHYPLYYLLIVITSFSISRLIIPSIIHVAKTRHLYDDLGYLRKIHNPGISRLGGVAIFVSFSITLLLWNISNPTLPSNFLLTACILLFAIGIKDDLAGVGHRTKFVIQFIAALILVIPGNIRLSDLHDILGMNELSYITSVIVSMLIIMIIINAFNLIDGIDGLAAVTGIIVNSFFSALFIYIHQYELAAISLTIVGAILGFLKFNITPAKIFMGDTGSLIIGMTSSVIALKFIEVSSATVPHSSTKVASSLGITLAILIGPIADTIRVFIIRLVEGRSPFQGDRNHIHHRVLRLGFSHLQTTIILALLNLSMILIAFIFSPYGNTLTILIIIAIIMMMNWVLTYLIRSKERMNYRFMNLFV